MRCLFIIFLSFFYSVTYAQEGLQLMESMKGQMKNSYMDIKWIDADHFTYTLDEAGGRMYYIADTKSWKPQRMFDNIAFADSLNRISQGGQTR